MQLRLSISYGLIVLLFSCTTKEKMNKSGDSTVYAELHRPQFHFSPPANWINDPNGLVYLDGEYHLFYQYNPYGTTWGHMSWGHAVTSDLLHWEHLPVAITEYPDPLTGDSTMIFSGTAVIDKNNTSGLCESKECMIAIYTSHVHAQGEGKTQHQSLAYSNDKGRTWKGYEKNPILDIKRKDFRDPKVFWYEPEQKWVMALVIPDQYKVQLYQSKNLTDWKLMSEFGDRGDTLRIWECPDLFSLPIDNEPGKRKWVLSLSGSHPQGPAFVGMQYFVGEFDGTKFIADDGKQSPRYVDHGKDFYAGIVYNNIPEQDGRTIMIGWANNWTYGNKVPTSPWRGAMALPRVLSLKKQQDGYLLIQKPIASTSTLRTTEITDKTKISGKTLELEIEIQVGAFKEAGVKILKTGEEETIIGYNAETKELFLDRTHSGEIGFNKDFRSIERAAINPINGVIKLHIFVDHSIVEIFVNDGELTFCDSVFPTQENATVETYSIGGAAEIKIKAWELSSVWR